MTVVVVAMLDEEVSSIEIQKPLLETSEWNSVVVVSTHFAYKQQVKRGI